MSATVVSFGLGMQIRKEGIVRVSFLDVGQGDAILIRQGNFDLLVDGGPDLTVLQRLGETRPAWDRKIDVLILTHPDADHLNGLFYTLKKYEVGTVVLPKLFDKTNNYQSFLQTLREKNVAIVFAQFGESFNYRDIKVAILSPDEKMLAWGKSNINNAAVVAKVIVPGYSLLLTGDIEAPTENYLAQKLGAVLSADILKVGHHGSKSSTSVSLLDVVKPKMAVISVATKNLFGHPHLQTLKRLRGIKIERTDRMGTVTVESEKSMKMIRIKCNRACNF